jgi:hypothetical protein
LEVGVLRKMIVVDKEIALGEGLIDTKVTKEVLDQKGSLTTLVWILPWILGIVIEFLPDASIIIPSAVITSNPTGLGTPSRSSMWLVVYSDGLSTGLKRRRGMLRDCWRLSM